MGSLAHSHKHAVIEEGQVIDIDLMHAAETNGTQQAEKPSLAESLLKSVAGMAFSHLADAILNDYFPEDFKSSVDESLVRLSVKIDAIGQDIAYLRIQPVTAAFTHHIDYFTNTFLPALRLTAKQKQPNTKLLLEEAGHLYNRANELRAVFLQGQGIYHERLDYVDLPLRIMFETLCNIAALRLSMISWSYALLALDADGADKRELMARDYAIFRTAAREFLRNGPDSIRAKRLSKIRFEKLVKMFPFSDRYDHVRVLYADSFSSHFTADPFVGDAFERLEDREARFWDIGPLDNAKQILLARAAKNADEWENEKNSHVSAVVNLVDKHVTEPYSRFAIEYAGTPETLPGSRIFARRRSRTEADA